MDSIENVIKSGQKGLYYGNRVLLPFHANLLKVVIEQDIITDFSPSSKGCFVKQTDDFIEIYFYDYPNLKETISKYENIKMVAVDKGKSVFDLMNHKKIVLYLEDKHQLRIEEIDEDEILFIE